MCFSQRRSEETVTPRYGYESTFVSRLGPRKYEGTALLRWRPIIRMWHLLGLNFICQVLDHVSQEIPHTACSTTNVTDNVWQTIFDSWTWKQLTFGQYINVGILIYLNGTDIPICIYRWTHVLVWNTYTPIYHQSSIVFWKTTAGFSCNIAISGRCCLWQQETFSPNWLCRGQRTDFTIKVLSRVS